MSTPGGFPWRDRRVVVTGHTGFKGAWLSLWLETLGAETFGLALPPIAGGAHTALAPHHAETVHADIRVLDSMRSAFDRWRPEVVFHLAAQALVPESYRDPLGTFETNITGTANVIAAAAEAGARAVVVVTSDKVYANHETGRAFVEGDPLGGHDPYSASKASAELVAAALRPLAATTGTMISTARSGNVIGGGDVAADRLLPDTWRAINGATTLLLRNPEAVRPWQFVLEPLHGYLMLAELLLQTPGAAPPAINFGPDLEACRPVREVVELAIGMVGRGAWAPSGEEHPPEATLLRLDAGLARSSLGWTPMYDLEAAVARTVAWWDTETKGDSLRSLGLAQLAEYAGRVGRPLDT